MKIRMLTAMSGSRDGQPWPKEGEEAELPTAAAAHLVASGVAEEVTDERPPPKRRQRERGGSRADVADT